jgi:hypothetical protein
MARFGARPAPTTKGTPMSWGDDVVDRDHGELAVPVNRPEIDAHATTLADFPRAFDHITAVLVTGEAKHRGAWRRQPIREHVDHVMAHLVDGTMATASGRHALAREHFSHAATRMLMIVQRVANDTNEGGQER